MREYYYISERDIEECYPSIFQGPKTSKEVCEEFGLQNVEFEYTNAEYQNLTTYNLFVQHIRHGLRQVGTESLFQLTSFPQSPYFQEGTSSLSFRCDLSDYSNIQILHILR